MYSQYNFPLGGYMSQQQFNQPQNVLKVNGIEGARAYQMAPNSMAALFDSNEDIFYIKTSDAGGFSNIQAYSFKRIEERPAAEPNNNYVTRKEFDELKEAIDGKFNLWKQQQESSEPVGTV